MYYVYPLYFHKQCTINYYTNKKINQVANKKIPLQMTQKFNFSNDPAGYVENYIISIYMCCTALLQVM